MSDSNQLPAGAGQQPLSASAQAALDVRKKAAEMFRGADKNLLPETLTALKLVPEEIRPAVEMVTQHLFEDAFRAVVTAHLSAKNPNRAMTPGLLAHSAKLEVFWAVGSLARRAWHLVDDQTLERINNDLQGARTLESAHKRIDTIRCVNMFVAATPDDDRDSYLRAVAALVKRHKVHSLVFDGEIIEWSPAREFSQACEAVGLLPLHVGIADKSHAPQHSSMAEHAAAVGRPALFVDSSGHALRVGEDGALEPAGQRPSSTTSPATSSATSSTTSRARQPTIATLDPAAGAAVVHADAAPTASVQARIEALRGNQARRAAARP